MTFPVILLALSQTSPACGKSFATGMEEYRRQDFTKALIAFRAASQCDPGLVQAHLVIANIYAERGNDGEAVAALLQALQIDPANLLALRAASNLYLKAGLHMKALPLLETLVRTDPKAADAHADLASVYAASGNREGAEKSFRRALELQPDYFPALAGLGNLLARAGEDATALPLLRQASKLQPAAWEGHFLLGSALNRLGQFAEAQAELEQAGKLGGKAEPQVFYQLARSWGGLGNSAERKQALATFSALTKQEKESEERRRQAAAWVDEARKLVQAGQLEEAVRLLELAREASPGDATLLFRLAGLNFDLHRLDAAREYAQAAISISPATWLYHYLLGLVEREAKHLSDALASLETAASLQSTEGPVFNALGEVLLEQGQPQAAISAFEKAVNLVPDDATFRKNLAQAKRNQK